MVLRLRTSLLVAAVVSMVAAVDLSATEPALTPATTTTTTVAVVTPQPTTTPSPLYSPEPSFPIVELIVECFAHLSLPCAQRKMVVYIDRLNRAKSVSIIGNFLELVKTRPDTAPPLTEEVLTARQIQDQDSLSGLLDMVADRFMDSHVLRLNLPLVEDGKVVPTPVDINFVTPSDNAREGRGVMEAMMKGGGGKGGKGGGKMKGGKGGGKMKKKGGKMMMKMAMAMGKKGMEMLGKMMMFKLMMMFPIAMGKSMIGGMAGLMSIGVMKFMMMRQVFDMLKNKLASCGGGGGGGGGGGFFGGMLGGGNNCGGGGGGGGGGYDRTYRVNSQAYYPYQYYIHRQEDDDWFKRK